MDTITIDLPKNSELSKAKMVIAISLYENEFFSTGQAAEFLEISRVKFIEELNKRCITTLSETENDLLEIKNINLVN